MSDEAAKTAGRVGLVVHYSASNYGNHLVNFATRWILEQCGCEVDLLVLEGGRRSLTLGTLGRLPLKLLRLGPAGLWHRLSGRLGRRLARDETQGGDPRTYQLRLAKFRRFSEVHLRPVIVDVEARAQLPKSYDVFAVGSDQIWNYDYALGPWQFLDFADDKRIVTLSPSVGHDTIPREWQRSYMAWLSRFREVGVRELRWTETLPDWEKRPDFTLLLDPTLMVPRGEWEELAGRQVPTDPYVLVYALGDLLPEQQAFVTELADLHGLEIRRLSDKVGGELWASDASGFLGMIAGAACVVTDSYHGAIFSFQFDRPLVLIRRHGFAGAMNSRVETLVGLCDLGDRFIDILRPGRALGHDYSEGHRRLDGHRADYWSYLSRNGFAPPTGGVHHSDRGERE